MCVPKIGGSWPGIWQQTLNALYLSSKMKRRQTLDASVAFSVWSLLLSTPVSLVMLRICNPSRNRYFYRWCMA